MKIQPGELTNARLSKNIEVAEQSLGDKKLCEIFH